MKLTPHIPTIALAAMLTSSEGLSQTAPDDNTTSPKFATPALEGPIPLTQRPWWTVTAPPYEPAVVPTSKAGFDDPAALQARAEIAAPASTTLSPPVTLSYSGSSSVLTIANAGTGQGVQATNSNAKNSNSALWGTTDGTGAGVSGYNSGTGGLAAKFGITNSGSSQPAVAATTNGTGPALLATVTNTSGSTIVIDGINSSTDLQSVGVEGSARGFGVVGSSVDGEGVSGASQYDIGVYGSSSSGVGVYAFSSSGAGLEVGSYSGIAAIFAGPVQFTGGTVSLDSEFSLNRESTANGTALYTHNKTGWGAYVASDNSYALVARSTNSHAVDAQDVAGGYGIYASSATGYAGWFQGKVMITDFLVVDGTAYTSDRNLKTGIAPVDGQQVLEKIAKIPVQSWDYKAHPNRRHIGPMAQDFHAAFGLNGDDDTHITDVDAQGVSFAAIQELYRQNREMIRQNQEISRQNRELWQQNADLQKNLSDLHAAVDALQRRSQ
jgi:hypothetical protein